MAQTVLHPSMLEACIRDVLNIKAPRTMVVLDPLKVTVTNFPTDQPGELTVPDFPADESRGSHKIAFGRTLYIERSDFRETSDKNYKRLACDQPVGLRHAGYVIAVEELAKDENDIVTELFVTCKKTTDTEKPKGFIHWVCRPVVGEVRLYDRLFHHANPEDASVVPGGFLTDVNKNSLQVISGAYFDASLKGVKTLDKFQFERLGFFAADRDTTPDKVNDQLVSYSKTIGNQLVMGLQREIETNTGTCGQEKSVIVFNRTVTLKEDRDKN